MAKLPVLMDHDGGVDDYLATVLLMTMDHVHPVGIVVTPADCYVKAALSATRKILDLMERSMVPVAESTVRGLNPFPRIFRPDSFTVDNLPILNERETVLAPLAPETGQSFMARVLDEAQEPVTLLVTGPLTTVRPRSTWLLRSMRRSRRSCGWAAPSTCPVMWILFLRAGRTCPRSGMHIGILSLPIGSGVRTFPLPSAHSTSRTKSR